MRKIIQWTNKHDKIIISILVSAFLAACYFFHQRPFADAATSVKIPHDWLMKGFDVDGRYSSLRGILNPYHIIFNISYLLAGYSEHAIYLMYAVLKFLCWIPTVYLAIADSKRNITALQVALILFIYMSVGINYVNNGFHQLPAFISLMILCMLRQIEQKRGSRRYIIWACILGSLMFFAKTELLLLFSYIIFPVCLYIGIYIIKSNDLKLKKIIMSAMFIGMGGAILLQKYVHLFSGLFMNYYGSYIEIKWTSIEQVIQNIWNYIQCWLKLWCADFVGEDLISLESIVYIAKILVVFCVIIGVIQLSIELIKKKKSMGCFRGILLCSIVVQFIIGILSSTDAWYSQSSYYLWGILLCICINENLEKLEHNTQWKRQINYCTIFLLILIAVCIEPLKLKRNWENADAVYDVCEYLQNNEIKYGLGSIHAILLPEILMEGKISMQPIEMDENGDYLTDTIYHNEYNDYSRGCNTFSCFVFDGGFGFSKETIKEIYGEPQEEQVIGNTKIFVYDYDVRYRPQEISSSNFTEDASTVIYRMQLPVGKSRITINDISDASVYKIENTDGIDYINQYTDSEQKKLVYEVSCLKNCDIEIIEKKSEQNSKIEVEAVPVYSAVDIATDFKIVAGGVTEKFKAISPAQQFEIVIQGENLDNVVAEFSCEATQVSAGKMEQVYLCNTKEEKIEISIRNNSETEAQIEKVSCELTREEREKIWMRKVPKPE